MNPLKPLDMSLCGTTLIEASAGTGKTYTITTLFLRILLEQRVSIDKILVVTFTIAATEELRIKITERVLLALSWLKAESDAKRAQLAADALLTDLLQRHDQTSAIKLLEDAASRLDEAAVYTIDAFCMRVLQDHAFETGMPYRTHFVADDLDIKTRAVQDFWRFVSGSRSDAYRQTMETAYKTPDGLAKSLEPLYRLTDAEYMPVISGTRLERLEADVRRIFVGLQTAWSEHSESIVKLLTDNEALKKNIYKAEKMPKVFNHLETLTAQPVSLSPLGKDFELLTTHKIEAGTKSAFDAPQHPLFELCEELWHKHDQWISQLSVLVKLDAIKYIRQSIKRFKETRSILHFEDLRVRLFESINSPSGRALASHVRQRWPFALIDEFQDTDPQQYHIFSQVYAGQMNNGLFLIGDPKQAIYSFRGADIFAYIKASRDTNPDNRYTLDTNWRSAALYVEAINAVFSGPAAPFVYNDEIPFSPVKAAGVADKSPLVIDGEPTRPLQFWLLQPTSNDSTSSDTTQKLTAGDASSQGISACATNIRQLLEKSDRGMAVIGNKPLNASDIAVLVQTNIHAEQTQLALRDQGVRSVRLANRGVFESAEAKELLVVLKAITEPARTGLVRAALATELLGYTALAIDALNHSESAWDTLITRMLEYNDVLSSRGVIACLQRVYADMQVPQRLLAQPGGEQKLTNVLQIAEVLQVASRDYGTVVELLQWMADRIDVRSIDEELLLRLESDENLVKIVTIHKSKGLEYPVVFMPVPWDKPKKENTAVFHDPQTLKVCVDLGSDSLAGNQLLSVKEDFAERLRVAYVALTRAKNLCVVCWGPVREAEKSSFAYLLHPRISNTPLADKKAALTADEIVTDLEALATVSTGVEVRYLDRADFEIKRYQASDNTGALQLKNFTGSIRSDWRISSYTGLLRNDNSERPDHDAVNEVANAVDIDNAVAIATESTTVPDSPSIPVANSAILTAVETDEKQLAIFQIPAGSRTGEFLHHLFEHIDFTDAAGVTLADAITSGLSRYGNLGRHDPVRLAELADACDVLVHNTLEADLFIADTKHQVDRHERNPASGDVSGEVSGEVSGKKAENPNVRQSLQLKNIGWSDRLNELEFYFSVANASVDDITRVLSTETAYRHTATGLSFGSLTGLMHGYIDLVVRQNGRYYILDYKSNLLGPSLESYCQDSLRAAVQSHRYDLQYLIYTIALHRYLRNTVPGYQYNEHFGGVFYLFLRGMRVGQSTGIWFDRPSESIVNALDTLFGGPHELTVDNSVLTGAATVRVVTDTGMDNGNELIADADANTSAGANPGVDVDVDANVDANVDRDAPPGAYPEAGSEAECGISGELFGDEATPS